MDIYWYGQSCFKLKGKSVTVITDPFDPSVVGLKKVKQSADIVSVSHQHADHNFIECIDGSPFVVPGPGEYEVLGVRILGIQTYHDAKNGKERGMNTMFLFTIDGIHVLHCGDLGHELSNEQLHSLSEVDILLIPIGGVYTIDAVTAVHVIEQIEPKVVIPMHYAVPGLQFQLGSLDAFLHAKGSAQLTPLPKYSITKDKLPENEEIVVLEL